MGRRLVFVCAALFTLLLPLVSAELLNNGTYVPDGETEYGANVS